MDTRQVIDIFENAFQTHDPAGLAAIIDQDCVLENTGPAPDGARYEGQQACLGFWTDIVKNTQMSFDEEKIDILGERALIFWRLKWGEGKNQSVRGVNIMTVKNGKITEGLGYMKA